VAQLFEETRARGLLIGKGGLYGNVIRIAPPLTAAPEQIDAGAGDSRPRAGRGAGDGGVKPISNLQSLFSGLQLEIRD
jgi:hypothetical protein